MLATFCVISTVCFKILLVYKVGKSGNCLSYTSSSWPQNTLIKSGRSYQNFKSPILGPCIFISRNLPCINIGMCRQRHSYVRAGSGGSSWQHCLKCGKAERTSPHHQGYKKCGKAPKWNNTQAVETLRLQLDLWIQKHVATTLTSKRSKSQTGARIVGLTVRFHLENKGRKGPGCSVTSWSHHTNHLWSYFSF